MKIFDNVHKYLKEFKVGDQIVLQGESTMDGIENLNDKNDVLKVHADTTRDNIVVTEYRGRKKYVLGASSYKQKVAVLTKEEFNNLPVLW